MDSKLINNIKMYRPWSLFELIQNELSEQQRRSINWYLLKMAIKAKKNNSISDMNKFIYDWHKEEIEKLCVKSIYHESR